jgi:tight adherence protein C
MSGGISPQVVEISTAVAFASASVGTLAWQYVHPRRRIRHRMAPYTEVAIARLGGQVDTRFEPVVASEALRRVLGPLTTGVSRAAARLLHLGDTAGLELKLRRSGLPLTVEQYRRNFLRWLIATPVALSLLGVLAGNTELTVLCFAAGVVAGARRLPDQLKGHTRRRAARMRSDLPTVAGMLALKIENNKSLLVALADLTSEGSGPVIEELARALHLINAGFGDMDALDLVSTETPEPSAARFYRFLAAATTGGVELSPALIDLANEMRTQRREEVERSAAKRQMGMIVPMLACMMPVLFLFMLAPLPKLLFGR